MRPFCYPGIEPSSHPFAPLQAPWRLSFVQIETLFSIASQDSQASRTMLDAE